jgi:NADH-quinone oxidoreductase subunit C
MSIIEETRIALLELFPEQAAADAEARAQAELEAEEAAAQTEIDAAAEEMESMDLTPDEAEGKVEVETAEAEAAAPKKKAKKKEPEEEVPRENGVLSTDHAARGTAIDVLCTPEQVVDAARIMDEQKFFLEAITGVDWNKDKKLEVIYDYNQYGPDQCRVVVRTFLDRAEPEIVTISDIHPSANWHERETHDFYGIKFKGHPHLIPILLPEDADFHPLLKDFKP